MTREIIQRIPDLNKKILRYEGHLIYLREKATALPTLSTEEKVKSSRRLDSMKYADAAVDLEQEITQMKEELSELTEEAKEWIETLDSPLERRIFNLRLVKYYTWEEIAELIGYSSRRLRQMKRDTMQAKL